jgi:hypothetical protein
MKTACLSVCVCAVPGNNARVFCPTGTKFVTWDPRPITDFRDWVESRAFAGSILRVFFFKV